MRNKLMDKIGKINGTYKAPYKLTTIARNGCMIDAVGFMEDLMKMYPEAIVKMFRDETEKWPFVVYMWEKRES